MLFRDCKPGWVVKTTMTGNQYVVSVPVTNGNCYNAYRIGDNTLYYVNPDVSVEHIGYIAIETLPKAPEFITVPRPQ